MDDVYNSRILEFAGNIPRIGRLDAPDASAKANSKLCGSTVTVDLKLDDDKVSDFAHDVKACALGQASASIVARNIIGAGADELYALRDAMRAMLKEGGEPPHHDPRLSARWKELEALVAIRDYPQRHASTMLVFEAVCACLDALQSRRNGAVAKA